MSARQSLTRAQMQTPRDATAGGSTFVMDGQAPAGQKPFMRVIHVLTTPTSLGFIRGHAAFMRAHQVRVQVISSPGAELDAFADSEDMTSHRVPMRRAVAPLQDIVSLVRLFLIFRRERPQIVHSHTPKASLLAGIAGFLAGVPWRIFHIHGLPHSTGAGLTRKILWWSSRIPAVLASQVICVSKSAAAQGIAEGIAKHIVVLHNGSSNGVRLSNRTDAVLENKVIPELQLPPDAVVIGFAGRLVRDKGICELEKAWQSIKQEFPSAFLVIAGTPEKRDPVPQDVLDRLSADPRVRILGWWKDMPAFYSVLHMLVLPSFREGLPTVVLEAAAMGIPTVASSCVGCVDVVVNDHTGLLIPVGSADAIADGIRKYIRNPELRHQHGRAALLRVQQDFRAEDIWKATLDEYQAAMKSCASGRPFRHDFATRTRDLGTSAVLSVLLFPLIAVLSVLVRFLLGKPVLFRQERPGLNGRLFTMYKFRTMRDANDEDGNPLPDNERLTPFGRFLRSTSLDELPELWNVLKGDMSLVGPRPLLPEYLSRYTDFQGRRHEVKPGITGWAQINGRNGLSWEEKFALDVWYVDNQAFSLDMKILWRTLLTVVKRDGITENGQVTMSKFMGSVEA
jgi:lipopolysaccharide/colanic/teichoic acid biosynthesis glycosyltransferase